MVASVGISYTDGLYLRTYTTVISKRTISCLVLERPYIAGTRPETCLRPVTTAFLSHDGVIIALSSIHDASEGSRCSAVFDADSEQVDAALELYHSKESRWRDWRVLFAQARFCAKSSSAVSRC